MLFLRLEDTVLKKTLRFLVEIEVDEDHEGVPDVDEVKLQLERAIMEGSKENVYVEFGILECRTKYLGEE